jgi:hypothetical protein
MYAAISTLAVTAAISQKAPLRPNQRQRPSSDFFFSSQLGGLRKLTAFSEHIRSDNPLKQLYTKEENQ